MTLQADEYQAAPGRYEAGMPYRRVGRSGLDLPAISLGLWHNFGDDVPLERQQATLRRAFDRGVTHFDLANNYGPPYGSAERNFGTIFARDFSRYRDELIISSKAGYDMWPGPYGQGGGSRKYVIASCEQSLKRMGLDYVDIFYSHRFDETTPLEETMGALDSLVRSGKALYVGISSYSGERTREAAAILREMGTPLLIHQPSYSMLNRWIEEDLLDAADEVGAGVIAFSPLAQGMLTNKYLSGIPEGSRAAQGKSLGPGAAHRGLPAPRAGAQRDGAVARAVAGPDGAGLGVARPAGHLGAHRCVVGRAARQQPGCRRQPGLHRRRARADRPARGRGRHQPVEDLEREVS
jgi:L-glyceraldehyde 3-phosphate reductase